MKFQPIPQLHIEGAHLFGKSVDCFHTEAINSIELGEWVDTFKEFLDDAYKGFLDEDDDDRLSPSECFVLDFAYFCMYVAASDGYISDDEIDGINQLLRGRRVVYREDLDTIMEIVSKWKNSYSVGFTYFVVALGVYSDDLYTTGEIAYFYRQVARFIYSIDNTGEFDEGDVIGRLVESRFKYIECAYATDYSIVDGPLSIIEVEKVWKEYVIEQFEKLKKDACGMWRGVSGNALYRKGLSDFVLWPDGTGSMLRHTVFTEKRINISWGVRKAPRNPAVMIRIPDLDAVVYMLMPDPNRMIATVASPNAALNGRMATYVRRK